MEETLHQISLPVNPAAEGETVLSIALSRDIGLGLLFAGGNTQGIGVVSFIAQHNRTLPHDTQHGQSHLAIMSLPGRQFQRDRPAFGIGDSVDFGCQPATGTSHAAIVKPGPLNSIEKAFSKLKALLRKQAERTFEGLWVAIGTLVDNIKPQEAQNYFCAYEYDPIQEGNTLIS